jgi:thioesterase domain-containing protein
LRAAPPDSPQRARTAAELEALLLDAGMMPGEASLVEDAPVQVWHSLLAALAGYRLRPYPGRIHLVVGQESAELPDGVPMPGLDLDYRTYLERWRALALGGLSVQVTPGNHRTVLTEPLVGNLAALLDTIRAEARR